MLVHTVSALSLHSIYYYAALRILSQLRCGELFYNIKTKMFISGV